MSRPLTFRHAILFPVSSFPLILVAKSVGFIGARNSLTSASSQRRAQPCASVALEKGGRRERGRRLVSDSLHGRSVVGEPNLKMRGRSAVWHEMPCSCFGHLLEP
ncbi:hypothetical protein RRG08_055466 [Elysia crispata]|uniref:Uncharacterized protein n=1 Tax=Elysia crispata TaxID=231223 RepID=A0AAE0YQJ7_9GAST|nr:hypothetical protein RRG08_055466 [Elysia crispata]